MAYGDELSYRKAVPILLLISIIISALSLFTAMEANRNAKEAARKADDHHHSTTSSGTEVEFNASDTGQPNLMQGTGQPPTQ